MGKAKGSSSGRIPASCKSSARKASRARGLPAAKQGDLSEAAFVFKATSLGLIVSTPHGNLHPYDFIVDGGSGLWRVQVKSCATLDDGLYRVRICRKKEGPAVPYTESEIDFVVAYIVPEKIWYVLPSREVSRHTSLSFRPKGFPGRGPDGHAQYREAWHLLRERTEPDSNEVERQTPPVASVCASPVCDAKVCHMRKASVRDLRYAFKKIERLLHQGEEIQITKRRRVIARLVPEGAESAAQVPDFMGRLRATYGDKALSVSAAELVSEDRDRY
jgi:antitoxin (DNA-binding transcriptional repressor) of toxin-antitoxin stability system